MEAVNSRITTLQQTYNIPNEKWKTVVQDVKSKVEKTGNCLNHNKCFAPDCVAFKQCLNNLYTNK